jgi:hypothetical protein
MTIQESDMSDSFPVSQVDVAHIGSVAKEWLTLPQAVQLLGTTSRGIFLQLQSGGVIFLSFEEWRGPLSLNVDDFAHELVRITFPSTVILSPGCINFPLESLSIRYQQALCWQIPEISFPLQSSDLRHEFIHKVINGIFSQKINSPLGELLPDILESKRMAYKSDHPFGRPIEELLYSIKTKQVKEIVHALGACLGSGTGLTPSGDDLIIGFIFTLNRYQQFIGLNGFINILNDEMLRKTIQTTSLSASLIECAVNGQADERLQLALDGIMTGEPESKKCTEALSAWGSSSGQDTLAGIIMALKLFS